jgi:hypothetical protein
MPDYADFKESLVAFIDILGFSQAIRAIRDRDSFLSVASVVSALRDQAEAWTAGLPPLVSVSMTAMSDSVVISIPYSDPTCAYSLIALTAILQYQLLAYYKTPIRGYIGEGPVFHRDGLVFGAGYLAAYCGEKAVGGPPRVVVAPAIIDHAQRVVQENQKPGLVSVFNLLRRDRSDGLYFVDYLSPVIQRTSPEVQVSERQEISAFVDSALGTYPQGGSVHRKYFWLRDYLSSTTKQDEAG